MEVKGAPYRYQLLPSMTDAERAELRRSMQEVGYDPAYPVVVDEHGHILDGHNRYDTARSLGLIPTVIVKPGLSESQKRIYAVRRNVSRRHLTDAQKVMAGEKIEPDIAKEAATREKAGKPVGKPPDNCPEGGKGETRDQVAAVVGLNSGKTYERGKQTIAQVRSLAATGAIKTDLPDRLANGTANLKEARKEVANAAKKERDAETARVLEQALAATAGTDLERAHRRASLLKTLSDAMRPLYETAFRVEPETVAHLADGDVRAALDRYFADFARWQRALDSALKPVIVSFPPKGDRDAVRDA